MHAKHVFLDEKNIAGNENISGILIIQKDWRNGLQIRDVSTSRMGMHGRDVTATYADVRVITFSGIIDRMNGNSLWLDAVRYLENLFSLQSNPSILEPKKLTIIDEYDRKWTLLVKIKDPFQIEEWDENFKGSHWRWFTTLESVGDPTFYSENEEKVIGREGNIGGFTIPIDGFSLESGISWNEVLFPTIIIPSGNGAVYPRFVLTAVGEVNAPIIIRNMTDGNFFALDVSASVGDIIEINTRSQLCTKNGRNITFSRLTGSVWSVAKWETIFSLEDKDGGISLSDFNIEVYFKNSLL